MLCPVQQPSIASPTTGLTSSPKSCNVLIPFCGNKFTLQPYNGLSRLPTIPRVQIAFPTSNSPAACFIMKPPHTVTTYANVLSSQLQTTPILCIGTAKGPSPPRPPLHHSSDCKPSISATIVIYPSRTTSLARRITSLTYPHERFISPLLNCFNISTPTIRRLCLGDSTATTPHLFPL